MKKFLNDILTEDDGVTYCGAKVAAFIALLSYLGMQSYGVYCNHLIDFGVLGTGLAEVLAGCGILIAGKQITQKVIANPASDK